MDGNYEVLLDGQRVGRILVSREGLYYRFRCHCALSSDTVCKVQCGDISIGILVPVDDGFGLDIKLPVKRFAQVNEPFRIVPNRAVLEGKFIPICPEEPFAYLERLKDAYLVRRNGQLGMIIQEKAGM